MRVNPVEEPISPSSGEQSTGPSIQPSTRADRIVAVCPSCQATLSIRRVYLGNQVRCKQCEHIFQLRENEELQAKPAEPAPQGISSPAVEHVETERAGRAKKEHERLLGEHAQLLTAHGQLQSTLDRVEAEHQRLKAADHELEEKLKRVTNQLNEIRTDLGPIAPGDVRSLAQERESLRADVDRLQIENRDIRAEQAARAHLPAELQRSSVELEAVRGELELHRQQLEERDLALDAAHAETDRLKVGNQHLNEEIKALQSSLAERDRLRVDNQHLIEEINSLQATQVERDRLKVENQNAIEEIRALQATLAERDRLSVEKENLIKEIEALHATMSERDRSWNEQRDELRAQIETHRSALIRAENFHREAIERFQEEHRSTEVRYKHGEDRILELSEAHERLKADYRSMLEAEQAKQNKLSTELSELRANSEESARLAEQLIAANKSLTESRSTPDRELEAAHAQIEVLKQRLIESERVNNDLSETLASLGVRFNVSVRP
jgi:chromosome segregation ATPase